VLPRRQDEVDAAGTRALIEVLLLHRHMAQAVNRIGFGLQVATADE